MAILNRHQTGQSIAYRKAKIKPVADGFTEIPVPGKVKVTSYQMMKRKGVPVK